MASHLLLAMSGTSPSCASRFGGPNCCAEARKRLAAARACRPITRSTRGTHVQTCGINYTGSRFRRIPGVVLDDSGVKCRRRELQALRSMRVDDVNGEEARPSGHIEKEKSGAGGETTSECLYLKRTICDGETVEHSGSIIIQGDVSPGGCVSAGGDVIVLGRLQGVVQAGRAGEHSAIVFMAFQDHGVIKIGDEATLQLAKTGTCVPHVAMLAPDGSILIRMAVGGTSDEQNLNALTRSSSLEHGKDMVDTMKTASKKPSTQIKTIQNRRPARIALITGIYIFLAGLLLLGFPELFGFVFHVQSVSRGWIQVGAVLAVVFGVYYIGTAVGDLSGIRGAEAFYYSTIVGRIFIFLSFAWLVFVRAVPSALLIVGTVNLVGALLLWRALLKKGH
ncbi:hypothetical protein Mapa_015133 [Marchantia paleacea]|nr:hypothetical protein Mapa_015133 [Marchantia paleacea]